MNFTIIITTLSICCTAITLSDKWTGQGHEGIIYKADNWYQLGGSKGGRKRRKT